MNQLASRKLGLKPPERWDAAIGVALPLRFLHQNFIMNAGPPKRQRPTDAHDPKSRHTLPFTE
jgi:hypothetical protein